MLNNTHHPLLFQTIGRVFISAAFSFITVFAVESNKAISEPVELPDSNSVVEEEDEGEIINNRRWSVGDLQLQELGTECISFDENGKCVVSVQDYNQSVLFFQPSERVPLDSARLMVYDRLINIIYLADAAHKSGYTNIKGVENEVSRKLAALSKRVRGKPSDSLQEAALKELYRQMYDEHFAEKEEVLIDLIGSSDSAYIDSVFALLKKYMPKKSRNRRERKGKPHKKLANLPWLRIHSDELPDVLSRATDTLYQGEFTKPIATDYGRFVLRVARINILERITFEAARPMLLDRYHRNQVEVKREAKSAELKNYYEKYKNKFLTEDTLSLVAWLVPARDRAFDTNKVMAARRDTARFDSRSINSIQLPDEVRNYVMRIYRRRNQSNTLIGPVTSIYGDWYFIISGFRKGGKQMAFSQVKHLIASRLTRKWVSPLDLTKSERRDAIRTELLAMAYWRKLKNSAPIPTPDMLATAIADGRIDPQGLEEEMEEEDREQMLVRLWRENYWQSDIEAFKNDLFISELLFGE